MRIASSICILVVVNIILSGETDQLMCQSYKQYGCGKYDHLIKLSFNAALFPLLMLGNIGINRVIAVFSFLTMIIAIALVCLHSWVVMKEQ